MRAIAATALAVALALSASTPVLAQDIAPVPPETMPPPAGGDAGAPPVTNTPPPPTGTPPTATGRTDVPNGTPETRPPASPNIEPAASHTDANAAKKVPPEARVSGVGSDAVKYPSPAYGATPSRMLGLAWDRCQIYPMLFAQLDASASFGRGVSAYQRADGTGLNPGAGVQRARVGLRGAILDRWFYQFLAELGGTNSAGPNQTYAFRGGLVDAFVTYEFSKAFSLRFGQQSVPLTLENTRVPPSWDMMEGSRTAFVAIPTVAKDIGLMAMGFPGRFVYAVGLFNGEGQRRGPTDAQGDAYARLAVRFNQEGRNRVQLGVSGRVGGVDPKTTFTDAPTFGLTTERGYNFWSPGYTLNSGIPVRGTTDVRVLPSGAQNAVGGDLIVQLGDFDIQGDAVYMSYGRRETTRTQPDLEQTLRTGEFSGISYYVTANYWITEPSKILRAMRWDSLFLRNQREAPAEEYKPSVSLMARWEQMFLKYDSLAHSPEGIPRGLIDEYTTRIRMDSVQFHLALWLTNRIRLGVQWNIYNFPGDAVNDRRINNQALAPGAVVQGDRGTRARSDVPAGTGYLDPTYYQQYSPNARFYHEIGARVQLSLP